MIFTAYIGFDQIAAIGGEIKRPGRNIPIGLVGSVVIVLLLYLLVYFTSTVMLGPEALARAGDTAVVDAGAKIAGVFGSVTVLGAGLLATLSSANASILSASRTLFALARDDAVPAVFNRTGLGSNSPWITVLVTGLPCAGLAYLAPAFLAELASLVHLLIYGLICIAIWPARRRQPDWFSPQFTVPGHPALAVTAGVVCLVLIAFMTTAVQLAGLGLFALSAILLWIFHAGSRDQSN